MRQGFLMTDENVIDECRKANDWSGSCVCATLIKDSVLYLANLGDSNAVIFQFGTDSMQISKCVELSKPHKPKAEEERIDAAGGWVSADGYILGVLNCSRSLGDREMKHYMDFQMSSLKEQFERGQAIRQRLLASQNARKPLNRPITRRKQSIPKSDMKFLVSPSPDMQVYNLEDRDALLVIGSDGLWDYINSAKCVEVVNDAFSKRQNLDDVCEALVQAAQKASSPDDITAMVISLRNQ